MSALAVRPNLARLPNPGPMAYCGRVLEVAAIGRAGRNRRSESKPAMFWSPSLRLSRSSTGSVLIFPRKRFNPSHASCLPADVFRAMIRAGNAKQAEQALRDWSDHPPCNVAHLEISDYALDTGATAVGITYRSDKFSPRGETVDYIHPFEAGVRVYRGRGDPPSCLLIGGGKLTLTPRGLEH